MNKKIFYTILLLIFLTNINLVNASEYNNYIIENLNTFIPNKNFNIISDNIIKEESLGIDKIKYLPNNVKYNIKKANSAINLILSTNKLDKINLQIKESLTNIKELEICYKKNDSICVENAIKNYKNSKISLYEKLDKSSIDNILESLLVAEINENIILNNIQKIYKNTSKLDKIIIEDKQQLSNYLNKSNPNLLNLKNIVKKSIDRQNKNKSLLNTLTINNYLQSLSLSDKKTKLIFDQTIEENYKTFIENINNLNTEKENIDIEKNLRYYLFYKYNNNIVEEINLINKLYKTQENVNNSKINSITKLAILNSKKSPIAILSQALESNIENVDIDLERLVKGNNIEKINVILLLKKQNISDDSTLLYDSLEKLEQIYTNKIYSDLVKLNNIEKEKTLTEYYNSLSSENLNFIKTLLDKLQETQTKTNVLGLNTVITKFNTLLEKSDLNNSENGYCPQNYKPVCGINKKTYTNSCFIEMVSVKISHNGECIEWTDSNKTLNLK